jgi:hypothetical protein
VAPALEPTHLEFVSNWFPDDAASALHFEVAMVSDLASRMHGSAGRFSATLGILDLIRDHTGFDHSQVERITTATIVAGVPGTLVFFTLADRLALEEHFTSGQCPIDPQADLFNGLGIYKLSAGDRPLGLLSDGGKHFVLGDWEAFKSTLKGTGARRNELSKILALHSAPIIICSNPREQAGRHAEDAPFGSMVSIEFDQELIAFLMQEEQATPDMALERHAIIQEEMPALFDSKYGLSSKKGVRYKAFADGRHVIFGGTASIGDGKLLLESLLGPTVSADPDALASKIADQVVELFDSAHAAGVDCAKLTSEESIVAALCTGLEGKSGARFQLPFLTGVERRTVVGRLHFESGKLGLAPVPIEPDVIVPDEDEKQLRRQAQLIATLSSSAAAADSPQLKKLQTAQEIIEVICTTGLESGPGYAAKTFKGPELTETEARRVAEFLIPAHGYLVYRAPSEDARR